MQYRSGLSSKFLINIFEKVLNANHRYRELTRDNPVPEPGAKSANAENLLDMDFDNSAPASGGPTIDTSSGGTPARISSPISPTTGNNLNDLLGVFDSPSPAMPSSSGLVGDFEGLNFNAAPSKPEQQKRTNEDILSLF